jgi:hypothetical protein
MSRPHSYSIITLTLAAVIAAGQLSLTEAAQEALLPSTSTDLDLSTKFAWLIAGRGLADGAMSDPRASAHIPSPLPGSSVSESVVSLSDTGKEVSTATVWSEPLGSGSLELQESIAAAGQTTIEYWLLASDRRRCILSGDAIYGKDGRLLSSNFWRNDPQLHFAGSPQLPNDVFPSHIPTSALLPALDASKPGATGKLNMVLGRYGYMTFDLWAEDVEIVTRLLLVTMSSHPLLLNQAVLSHWC